MCLVAIPAAAIAYASLATAVVGAGVSAYGAVQSANAQEAAGKYQAQVATNNAKIQEQNAQATEQAGAVAEQAQGLKTAQQAGAIKAAVAANGLEGDTGSAKDLSSSVQKLGMTDLLTVRNNFARTAYGQRGGEMASLAQSQLDRAGAANAGAAGGINAATSLLSGASSVSDKWMTYNSRGVFV